MAAAVAAPLLLPLLASERAGRWPALSSDLPSVLVIAVLFAFLSWLPLVPGWNTRPEPALDEPRPDAPGPAPEVHAAAAARPTPEPSAPAPGVPRVHRLQVIIGLEPVVFLGRTMPVST